MTFNSSSVSSCLANPQNHFSIDLCGPFVSFGGKDGHDESKTEGVTTRVSQRVMSSPVFCRLGNNVQIGRTMSLSFKSNVCTIREGDCGVRGVALIDKEFDRLTTNLLSLVFAPDLDRIVINRLSQTHIDTRLIQGKHLHVIDRYFDDEICSSMREIARTTLFDRSIFASSEAREMGEMPAQAMSMHKEWQSCIDPCKAFEQIYRLFGFVSQQLESQLSMLPWRLCTDRKITSAFATNRLEGCSSLSMEAGKHKDYDTSALPFAIPVLYEDSNTYYRAGFTNGECGRPLLISAMLYVTAPNFDSSTYGLGTVFCTKDRKIVKRVESHHMRLVLFEGDIVHSIEESTIPPGTQTWRISYVFKLIINPKSPHLSLREKLYSLLHPGNEH